MRHNPIRTITISAPAPPVPDPVRWLNNQPYLLLSLTALFWAGNIVLARYVAGHVPLMTLSCVRWIGAFFMLLPFAWPHLKRDWPALRARLPLMVALSATGFAINNTLSYWALRSIRGTHTAPALYRLPLWLRAG
jgi:drug/metabolite transporter (DMT)-like permease